MVPGRHRGCGPASVVARATRSRLRSALTPYQMVTVMVVVLSMLGSGVFVYARSSAAFTASTGGPPGSWTAGTVTIDHDSTGSALFTATNMVPGTESTRCVQVTYTGDVAAAVRLHAAGSGTLANHLVMRVEIGSGGGSGSCTGYTATATLFTGTLSQLLTRGTWASGLSGFEPSGPAQAVSYRITSTLPGDTPNSAQQATATATLTWEARDRDGSTPAPLTWYAFDETAGTSASDSATNRNPATLADVALAQPPAPGAARAAGTSLGCNGTTTLVSSATGFNFSRRDPFTVSVWVRPHTIDSGSWRQIVGRGQSYGLPLSSRYGVSLTLESGEGFALDRYEQSGTMHNVSSGPGVQAGVWYHVAVAYDGFAMTLYVDGAVGQTTTSTGSVADVSDRPVTICSGEAGASTAATGVILPLDGNVDDLRIYHAALSATQIAALAAG